MLLAWPCRIGGGGCAQRGRWGEPGDEGLTGQVPSKGIESRHRGEGGRVLQEKKRETKVEEKSYLSPAEFVIHQLPIRCFPIEASESPERLQVRIQYRLCFA